jgi:polysaccharide pyruvyl transferase WcaK-like protein
MFLNVGAGPLTHPVSKSLVRWALLAADYVSFRDRKSRVLVQKIGFTGESQVCPDNAYSLDVATTDENPSERRGKLMVGFAPMPYPSSRAYLADRDQIIYDEFIQKLAKFASCLINQSYIITTFGTDIGVDPQAIQDFQTTLVNCLGSAASEYCTSQCVESVDDLLAAVSRMDYVVTCRFHGVVFAHLLNKPVLAIAHHPKVKDLMSDLGLSDYCVDIRNFNPMLLAQRFALMIDNTDEIKSRMAVSLQKNKHKLGSQFDELIQSLKSGLKVHSETVPKITELCEHKTN